MKQHGERAAALGSKLKAAQGPLLNAVQPERYRSATARPQCLLARPQLRFNGFRPDQHQARQADAVTEERGRVGNMGWRDHHQPAFGLGEARGGRHHDLQFADAGALGINLGQCLRRPACPRQQHVEFGKSGRHARHRHPRAVVAAPDSGMIENGIERGCSHG